MSTSLIELFQKGGPIMWPILICSILALGITIERWLSLARSDVDVRQFLSQLQSRIQDRNLAGIQQFCDQTPGPLSRIAKQVLPQYGRPRSEIREALEEAIDQEAPDLSRYIPILGTIAHLTPLMGLLGTVTGLVRCFQNIQIKATSAAPVNPADLAGGIWEALLTTVFGLLVAIPTYALYNYFAHRVNHLINSMTGAVSPLSRFLSEGKPNA
jgi:biopolymer transport protein ExbB